MLGCQYFGSPESLIRRLIRAPLEGGEKGGGYILSITSIPNNSKPVFKIVAVAWHSLKRLNFSLSLTSLFKMGQNSKKRINALDKSYK